MARHPLLSDDYKDQLVESRKGNSWFSFAPDSFFMYTFSISDTTVDVPNHMLGNCRVVDVC